MPKVELDDGFPPLLLLLGIKVSEDDARFFLISLFLVLFGNRLL